MGNLDDHLAKLRRVFIGLQDVGLKVNACKSFLCAMETEFLGYIFLQDSINPQPKTVQTIITLTLSQNVKQLH